MTLRAFPLFGVLLLLASAAGTPPAKAVLKDSQGKEVGTATFQPSKGGVKIAVQVSGLPPGRHGFHIHAAGKCEPPDFTTAGSHFNPGGKKHGHMNPEGAHAGDLPNLTVDKSGKGKATYTAKGITLGEGPGSLFGPEGTALVVHADPDDEKTDPTGNSGARIACGVIEKT
jgi:Cu-Zn family superoxide dismutase